jgi:hypothetical protein
MLARGFTGLVVGEESRHFSPFGKSTKYIGNVKSPKKKIRFANSPSLEAKEQD